MADFPLNQINGIRGIEEGGKAGDIKENPAGGFDTAINEAMNKVSSVQENVEEAVKQLATGGDITDAVLAMEKADMSFQLMVEIRNKLLSSYEEVMKMNV